MKNDVGHRKTGLSLAVFQWTSYRVWQLGGRTIRETPDANANGVFRIGSNVGAKHGDRLRHPLSQQQ